jgi:hypothetical protein
MAEPSSRLKVNREGIAFAFVNPTRPTQFTARFVEFWRARVVVAADLLRRQIRNHHSSEQAHFSFPGQAGFFFCGYGLNLSAHKVAEDVLDAGGFAVQGGPKASQLAALPSVPQSQQPQS